ncbi:MAG: threonine synthase [Alphaproteobacteria bacterium]|nr:threonine synthase [Alphaproteobacteria bacterium]
MYYVSTRDVNKTKITASKAIVSGLAPDGGLYVPCEFPVLHDFMGKSYEEIAFNVLKLYLTDFSDDELKEYVQLAYGKNLPVKINGDYLELFHGRTSAFKDVALQLYPYLLTASLRKNNVSKTAVVLVATSGDTGSAVLAGMANVPNTRAIVIYPAEGVSPIQRLQMTTQEGNNVHVFGIKGNFDDAQKAVKEIFSDEKFKAGFADKYIFTSANSINLGRLLPQIVYYFYAYSESRCSGKINFVVPTGNFGNILAGYYARKMGLPINKLICATNSNRVLDDFFKTGVYDTERPFYTTISPSMDILVSSNLERLIYENVSLDMFDSDSVTDEETLQTIKDVYNSKQYILDPHTAVGQCAYDKYKKRTGDETQTMILATASPYKFSETIESALGNVLNNPPENIKHLSNKPILHNEVIDNIRKAIGNIL